MAKLDFAKKIHLQICKFDYLIIFICFDSKKSQGTFIWFMLKTISNIDKSTYIFISHCVALLVLHKLGEVIGLLGNLPVLYGKGLELFAYKYRRGAKHIYNGVTHLVTHIHLHNFTLAIWKKKCFLTYGVIQQLRGQNFAIFWQPVCFEIRQSSI